MRQALGVVLLTGAVGCGTTQPTPVVSLDGVYELTIESSCTALPLELRQRRFFATIQGPEVTLSGSPFFPHPTEGLLNRMSIAVDGTSAALHLDRTAGREHVGLLEEPSPGQYLSIVGAGGGTIAPASSTVPTIEGTLAVYIRLGTDVSVPGEHEVCAPGVPASFQFQPARMAGPAPQAGTPTLARVDVTGPPTIAPGEAGQFTAVGTFSDGASRDITADVVWWMSDTTSSVAGLAAPGLVQARSVGEAELRVAGRVPNTNTDPHVTVDVVVAPPGAVRVAGLVSASDSSAPVAGASVAVTAGEASGLSATTDWDGRYTLIGVSGPSTISVSKAGYGTEHRSVGGGEHQTVNVSLTPTAPPASVAGTYTLTLEADASCRSALPEAARRRVYDATLTQNGALVSARLSGGSFTATLDEFVGRAEPLEVRFVLVDYWGYYWDGVPLPSVLETISTAPWLQLVPGGLVRVSVVPGGLAGELTGSIDTFDREAVCCPFQPWTAPAPVAQCAGVHPFTLLRR
jgi:hypothetical protein